VALNRAGNREVNRLYFPQTNNGFKKTGTNWASKERTRKEV
jgi:hypothetical protein